MKTRFRGTFVISWSQTEIDGLMGAPVSTIRVGSTWRWTGNALRVDAPRDVLVLENAVDLVDLHRGATRNAPKLLGADSGRNAASHPETDSSRLFTAGFDLTDGHNRYRVTLVPLQGSKEPMLQFEGTSPPKDQDLWVVQCATQDLVGAEADDSGRGVICFVPGTRIATPNGTIAVQDLVEGDRISTKDNGEQEIRWIGSRRVTGARLYAMPHMRPIRMRANILGQGEPDQDLIVSPDHRILVKGPVAQALFNTPEVLVTARDMVNDSSITVDYSIREVTYIHVMLDSHQVIWANGVESESFHPAGAHLELIDPGQQKQLSDQFPGLAADPYGYGEFARRNLTASEAAILSYDSLRGH